MSEKLDIGDMGSAHSCPRKRMPGSRPGRRAGPCDAAGCAGCFSDAGDRAPRGGSGVGGSEAGWSAGFDRRQRKSQEYDSCTRGKGSAAAVEDAKTNLHQSLQRDRLIKSRANVSNKSFRSKEPSW